MAEDILVPIMVVGMLFVGLPWIIFHYITKWKTMGSITNEDENLLDELYVMARRLDDRMETVERIMRADSPDWDRKRLSENARQDDLSLENVERLLQERKK